MTTAHKAVLALLSELRASMMQRAIGNTQIIGDLRQGLLAVLRQLHRFQLQLFRKCPLGLRHGLFPFCGDPFFQVYHLHLYESKPRYSLSFRGRQCTPMREDRTHEQLERFHGWKKMVHDLLTKTRDDLHLLTEVGKIKHNDCLPKEHFTDE